jgi:hypothetical protein
VLPDSNLRTFSFRWAVIVALHRYPARFRASLSARGAAPRRRRKRVLRRVKAAADEVRVT